ncbi:MAG: serine/threonine-protein kinase [Planctomycetaceae bacterium]
MNEDALLEQLLDTYEEAVENGESPSIAEICKESPELADKLRERIAALDKMDSYLSGQKGLDGRTDENTLRVSSELTQLEFHARGGLGAVYRANESSVNREVAVKFIHRNLAKDADSRDRFTLEAEVTGRLEHPGVVPLYGVGEAENGRMFYYMRFIDGETMDDAIRRFHQNHSSRNRFSDQSVEFRRLLTSFVSACKTVAYAHNRGIVHRDIKPSNIMLGKYGETLVVDWGLAVPVRRDHRFALSGEMSLRPVSASSSGTTTASGVGTAAYMSPEQASELAPAPASDIYSLGATLYKLLTGEPSVSGDQATELKQQIITGKIVSPQERLPSVPRALVAICQHAMALHPHDRYATALDLAEDIENYLADSPVSVYKEPVTGQIARYARKHRSAAQTAALALVCLLLLSTFAAIWLASLASAANRARMAEAAAREEQVEAKKSAEASRRENLKTSAQFLAQSIGAEIDNRWRVLENARSSPELIEFVKALNTNPGDEETRTKLQTWLFNTKESRNVFRSRNSIWVLFGIDGKCLARVPVSNTIRGEYHYRDYFHAFGHDFSIDSPEAASATPHRYLLEKLADNEQLHSAHLSDVFLSTATNHLQVTLSVPIWDRPAEQLEKQAIGVFCISSEIQNLKLLNNAMLVQLRTNQISQQPGLVISHPELRSRTDEDLPPHVNEELVERAEKLKQFRLREQNLQSGNPVDSFIEEFVDPVLFANEGNTVAPCFAALEPVLIQTRPDAIKDTGWVVIVKEPSQPAEAVDSAP